MVMVYSCMYAPSCLIQLSTISKKSSGKNVTIGINSLRKIHPGSPITRHAEVDAVLKLPSRKKNNPLKICLVVLRVDKNGKLKNSRPCADCLKRLQFLHGYKIRYIYYSCNDGNIVKEKYTELLRSDIQHITRGHRHTDAHK